MFQSPYLGLRLVGILPEAQMSVAKFLGWHSWTTVEQHWNRVTDLLWNPFIARYEVSVPRGMGGHVSSFGRHGWVYYCGQGQLELKL